MFKFIRVTEIYVHILRENSYSFVFKNYNFIKNMCI